MQLTPVGAVATAPDHLDIATTIRQFIRRELAPDCAAADLGDHVSLLESGILDSYGIMTLLAFIESTFRISIRVEEIEPANFESVASISTLVDRMRAR